MTAKKKKIITPKIKKLEQSVKTSMAKKIVTDAPKESKKVRLIKLLQRSDGATIDEMAKATGWQRHSLRGAISGALKKRLGLSIISDVKDRGRVYRIIGSVSRS